jgi:hypothetical protein
MIQQYTEYLQVLYAVDELFVPVFVGPDEIRVSVYNIETMFDGYHSKCLVGLLFQFYLLSSFDHWQFFLVHLSVVKQTIEY